MMERGCLSMNSETDARRQIEVRRSPVPYHSDGGARSAADNTAGGGRPPRGLGEWPQEGVVDGGIVATNGLRDAQKSWLVRYYVLVYDQVHIALTNANVFSERLLGLLRVGAEVIQNIIAD